MITTLILGAGASKPYRYPTGIELLNEIKRKLSIEKIGPSADIFRGLDHTGIESLDSYMDRDKGAGPQLKQLIAEYIHGLEDVRNFNVDRNENPYAIFFDTVPLDQYKNFRFVSFNYDRSLEFYLARGLVTRDKLTWENAFLKISELKIVHVHGRLSNLPGEKGYENQHTRTPLDYGYLSKARDRLEQAKANGQDWVEEAIIGPIVRYGQANLKNCFENTVVCDDARNAIEESGRICFLGFGFHETNMATLGYSFSGSSDGKKICGTTWKISGNEFRRINHDYPKIIPITDCTAGGLLNHFVHLTRPELDNLK